MWRSQNTCVNFWNRVLSQRRFDTVAADLGADDALLIYCTRRAPGLRTPDGAEAKKIPRDWLAKCTLEEGK
jgi:hypothetical protein